VRSNSHKLVHHELSLKRVSSIRLTFGKSKILQPDPTYHGLVG